MNAKFVYIMGILFIFMSAIIYTIERAAIYMAENIKLAGFFAGHLSGEVPSTQMPGLVNNIYVPRFLLVGLALIAYGSLKKK